MSSAEHFATDLAINPYYSSSGVDVAQAVHEHEAIAQALEMAGVTVTYCSAPSSSQDGVYTANWALVRGDQAVLAKLPDARRSEEAHAEHILRELGLTVHHVPNGWHFSGQGDALAFGGMLFCGKGYRSDEGAQIFAAEILGFERVQLQTVPLYDKIGNQLINATSGWPDSLFYDLDLALAIIQAPSEHSDGLIAYCPQAFLPESQEILHRLRGVDKIEVDYSEAVHGLACNLVSTGETVIMSGHAPKLQAELERRGYTIITPDVFELMKGGGFIRCVSLTLQ